MTRVPVCPECGRTPAPGENFPCHGILPAPSERDVKFEESLDEQQAQHVEWLEDGGEE